MKENLKPYVYKQIKRFKARYRTFCRTVQRVIVYGEVKLCVSNEAEEKSSLKRAYKSYIIDPKPGDLSMVRMKLK